MDMSYSEGNSYFTKGKKIHKGGQSLEQSVHRGCGTSSFEIFRTQLDKSRSTSSNFETALLRGAGPDDLQRSLLTYLLHDSNCQDIFLLYLHLHVNIVSYVLCSTSIKDNCIDLHNLTC